MAALTKQRLDFQHGFIKSIVKNQIDRDNYEKEVKLAKAAERSKKRLSNPKKPEIQTYVPPSKQGRDPRDELFILEFEDQEGEIYSAMIYKTDNAEDVSRKIGMEAKLPSPYITALTQRLSEEIQKRS